LRRYIMVALVAALVMALLLLLTNAAANALRERARTTRVEESLVAEQRDTLFPCNPVQRVGSGIPRKLV
jgi:hypothetical protein